MKAVIGVALLAVCVFGQTFEQFPIKKEQFFGNPLLMTENTGMKTLLSVGDYDQLLSLQELIQHPLFQVYYQIPLFRQHFSHPLFQVWLVTPQFQNYWTHPVFPTFFHNSALFYKYIYPQVFTNNVQTPVFPLSYTNKVFPTTNIHNYEEVIRKVLGVEDVQKNIQGLYFDKIMKNTFLNINKPEEITEVKTEVKIPVPTTHTIVNPIEKILNEKLVEETLVNKDDFNKESLLKKFYLEKLLNKNFNVNKMSPEEFILFQNKIQELIPSRTRRHAIYSQIPTTNYNTYSQVLPYVYNYPGTQQQVYYTQPQTTFTNTVGTPYVNTVGTPYTYANNIGTPYTYANTVGVPYTQNTPFYYPTQTVV